MIRITTIFLLLLPWLPAAGLVNDTVKTEKTSQKVIAWMLNEDSRILPTARDTSVAAFEVFDPAYLFYRYPIKTEILFLRHFQQVLWNGPDNKTIVS